MKTINWSFITSNHLGTDHPQCIENLLDKDYVPFKSLSKEIGSSRKDSDFLRCPAHTDFLKNTFVFCAPFDLTIELEVDIKNKSFQIFCENISQEVFESLVDIRFLKSQKRVPLIGIDWLVVLTTIESTMFQLLPAFMSYNDFTSKTTVIPGEYDISKWTRPVETVFEVKNNYEKIVIKKGDAISYFKFLTSDKIKLIQSPTPWNEIIECNNLVNSNKFRPLKERYESLEKVRTNKCPYSNN